MVATKSDVVRGLVIEGEYKTALRIAKGFRLGISQADIDAMTLAYECMVHTGFYEELSLEADN